MTLPPRIWEHVTNEQGTTRINLTPAAFGAGEVARTQYRTPPSRNDVEPTGQDKIASAYSANHQHLQGITHETPFSMAKSKIILYVDIVSPFAYMAYHVLRHNPTFKSTQITYIPIFLGGLMKACNNTPPMQIRNKDKWIGVERLRWAKQFNIPITKAVPAGFPVLTLTTMRALCYVQMKYPDQLVGCIDALYDSFWVQANSSVGKPEGFGPVLERVMGKEKAEEAVKGAASPEAKKRLNENTDEALRKGAFGLPWFDCENANGENEGFWGFDHLGQVVRFLGLQPALDGQEMRALL
jgi:2-hydroxychromene-2-carboxylate isomerase